MTAKHDRTGTLLRWVHEYRFGILLSALLLALALGPFVLAHPLVNLLLKVAVGFSFAASLFAVWGRRVPFVLGVALMATYAVLALGSLLTDSQAALDTAIVTRLVFYAVVIGGVLRDIVRAQRVTIQTVLGACSVYLMLALSWAMAYALLEHRFPGSFHLAVEEPASWTDRFGPMDVNAKLIYYSLITITTVGYGDVTPLSSGARMLAAVEGLVGQLFVAVILARFVAMELTARSERGGSK